MIAKLKSAAVVDLRRGDNEIFALSDDAVGAKITEIIVSNKSSAQVKATIKVYKKAILDTAVIIPSINFLANEGKVIPMSTILEPGDKIIAETNAASSIDVLVSLIEL